jgi:hypothetical protein
VQVKQAGNYFAAVTVPMTAALDRTSVQVEIRVNGTGIDGGIGESSYIRNFSGHNESSSHVAVLLPGLSAGDLIEAYVRGRANTAGPVTIDSMASLYVEIMDTDRVLFSGMATQTTTGPDLNEPAAPLEWTEGLKSAGFSHNNSSNPESIVVDSAGSYLIFVNVPISGAITRGNIRVLVQVNGATVPGGQGKQGYIRNSNGHVNASVHWSGLVHNVSAGSTVTVVAEQEAAGGVITVQSGKKASIFIERIDTTQDIYFGRATRLTGGGTSWNPTPAPQSVLWETDEVIDTSVFTHSTASNAHQIVINRAGDYMLVYNDSFVSTLQRPNPKVTVNINGTPVPGAETKCHYIRNGAANVDNESSGSLVFLLKGLSIGDVITLDVIPETTITGAVDDDDDAILMLWRKP